MGKKIAALVPMRHHSQRVPGKNYRELAGKPLFYYIIESLLACPAISSVAVDTDSPIVLAELAENFPKVNIIDRPKSLCDDQVPMNEILLYDTSQIKADFYLQTHSTNPLLRTTTIANAIQTFLTNYPTYDSLFSVTALKTRLWDELARPVNHNPAILLQTQDLPPLYEENSCIYLFSRENLVTRRNRIGERPYMYAIPADEAWDIDDELDFSLVEAIMSKKQTGSLV